MSAIVQIIIVAYFSLQRHNVFEVNQIMGLPSPSELTGGAECNKKAFC